MILSLSKIAVLVDPCPKSTQVTFLLSKLMFIKLALVPILGVLSWYMVSLGKYRKLQGVGSKHCGNTGLNITEVQVKYLL